jgi:acyl-CoA dehydrogenase
MWANACTLRIVDGPDDVHIQQMGRNENKRHQKLTEQIRDQKAKAQAWFEALGPPTQDRYLRE